MARCLCPTYRIGKVAVLPKRNDFVLKPSGFVNRRFGKVSTKRTSSFEHCVDLVRKHDYENYLCTLLLPHNIRNAAFAIRAFNVEVAQVRDMVSKTDIGYIRMHFWKDALDRTFAGNPPMGQPTTMELAKILKNCKLSQSWFQNLIKCREEAMADKGFLTVSDMETYCEKSVSSVYYLILQAAGAADIHCDHAASHLGKSQGITNMLRSIPFHSSKGRLCLPMQIMSKHKISQEQLRRGDLKSSIQDAVFEVSSVANQHLTLSRELQNKVPNNVKPVFLPAVSVSYFLKSLEETNFDIFHPKHQRRNYSLPLSLLMHRIRKKY